MHTEIRMRAYDYMRRTGIGGQKLAEGDTPCAVVVCAISGAPRSTRAHTGTSRGPLRSYMWGQRTMQDASV